MEISFHGDVELKAEDTDIVCLLVHHFNSEHHYDIYLTTKKGPYCIREITRHLDHKEKEILLLIHGISGCDCVSGLFGFSKVEVLKKAVTFDEQGQLATLLTVRESKEKIIEAGLCFLQYI